MKLVRTVGQDDCIAYRIPAAAAVIGVSRAEMYRLINRGAVPAAKYGEARTSPRVVMREDLLAYVRSKKAIAASAAA